MRPPSKRKTPPNDTDNSEILTPPTSIITTIRKVPKFSLSSNDIKENYNKYYEEEYFKRYKGLTNLRDNRTLLRLATLALLDKINAIDKYNNLSPQTSITFNMLDYGCGDGRYFKAFEEIAHFLKEIAHNNSKTVSINYIASDPANTAMQTFDRILKKSPNQYQPLTTPQTKKDDEIILYQYTSPLMDVQLVEHTFTTPAPAVFQGISHSSTNPDNSIDFVTSMYGVLSHIQNLKKDMQRQSILNGMQQIMSSTSTGYVTLPNSNNRFVKEQKENQGEEVGATFYSRPGIGNIPYKTFSKDEALEEFKTSNLHPIAQKVISSHSIEEPEATSDRFMSYADRFFLTKLIRSDELADFAKTKLVKQLQKYSESTLNKIEIFLLHQTNWKNLEEIWQSQTPSQELNLMTELMDKLGKMNAINKKEHFFAQPNHDNKLVGYIFNLKKELDKLKLFARSQNHNDDINQEIYNLIHNNDNTGQRKYEYETLLVEELGMNQEYFNHICNHKNMIKLAIDGFFGKALATEMIRPLFNNHFPTPPRAPSSLYQQTIDPMHSKMQDHFTRMIELRSKDPFLTHATHVAQITGHSSQINEYALLKLKQFTASTYTSSLSHINDFIQLKQKDPNIIQQQKEFLQSQDIDKWFIEYLSHNKTNLQKQEIQFKSSDQTLKPQYINDSLTPENISLLSTIELEFQSLITDLSQGNLQLTQEKTSHEAQYFGVAFKKSTQQTPSTNISQPKTTFSSKETFHSPSPRF